MSVVPVPEAARKPRPPVIQMTLADIPILGLLTDEHRRILLLSAVNKHNYEKLRKALGTDVGTEKESLPALGTIKSRLHRAREELQRLLREFRERGHIENVRSSGNLKGSVGTRDRVLAAELEILKQIELGMRPDGAEILTRFTALHKRR
ncbi:MAG: hypothetical protein ACREGR_00850 [Minisyncoccia bacterium]